MSRRRAPCLALALAVAVTWSPASGRASDPGPAPGASAASAERNPEQTADFWREVKSPGYARSRILLRHGVERLAHAIRAFIRDPQTPQIGRAHVQNAIVRLQLAHARAPRDPEALYILAMARLMWPEPNMDPGLDADGAETMALLEELRRLDPGYQAARVAFELGILHTRAREFDQAAEEYRRCLDRILLPTEGDPTYHTPEDVLADRLFGAVPSPTVHYDLGDVTMALGDLQGAIAQYERAIAEGQRSNQEFRTVLLAHWGLAAALDRFGEHEAALEHTREAVRLDEEPMAVLHLSSVFFEPSYELHYYEALGHTVLAEKAAAQGAGAARTRHDELQAAIESWNRFLADGGDQSPWADLARHHRDEARKRLDALAKSGGFGNTRP